MNVRDPRTEDALRKAPLWEGEAPAEPALKHYLLLRGIGSDLSRAQPEE